jgi:hypothetical protein
MKKHNFTFYQICKPHGRAILGDSYLIPGCIYQTVEEMVLYKKIELMPNKYLPPKKVVIPKNQIILCVQNVPLNKTPGNEKSLNTEPYFEFLWEKQLLGVVNGSYTINQKLMIL